MSSVMAWIDAVPDSVSFTITVLLVLALCALSNWRNHASWGPDGEKPSRVRPGESPTEGPVVSRPALLQLEHSPECDRAVVLSNCNTTNVLLAERSSDVVRSTAAGAPAVFIYRWVRPAEGKKLMERGWWLEHVDPRYNSWLCRKEEKWP